MSLSTPTFAANATATPQQPALQRNYNWLTRTAAFNKLSRWAFDQCDLDGSGQLDQTELYAGLLLVHVNLAKYAGAAACYPPSRLTVNELFLAADGDNSGTINADEFTQIMCVCCSQIAGRMLSYYMVIVLLVPFLADALILICVSVDRAVGWGFFQAKHSVCVSGRVMMSTKSEFTNYAYLCYHSSQSAAHHPPYRRPRSCLRFVYIDNNFCTINASCSSFMTLPTCTSSCHSSSGFTAMG